MPETRLLTVLPSLHGGGAQRVMVNLLNRFSRERLDLHLAVFDNSGPLKNELSQAVTVHDLKAGRVRRGLVRLLGTIRRLSPSVVLGTCTHVNLAMGLLRPFFPKNVKLFLREVNVVSAICDGWRTMLPKRTVMRTLLGQADMVVCQSEFMRDDLAGSLRLPTSRTAVVYNPVDIDAILSVAEGESPFSRQSYGPNIVAIGSMNRPKKGFDRLIDAMPLLKKDQPEARLWILGEGRLEGELREQAQRLGVGQSVRFVGFQRDPYRWLKHADLFVLSSRHEGTPNVLLEAMACGCPTVVLDHPGGSRELMELTGQGHRVVSSLKPWDASWFERPPDETTRLLRHHFGVETIAARYLSLLCGSTTCDGVAAAA